MNAIEITNLTKKYKGFTLDNLCLNLPKGCIMGLIGENGAGKSTTIKMLLDIVRPDGGDIKIFGEKPTAIQKNDIGVVLDEVGIPESFTIKDINAVMKHSFNNWNEQTFFQYMAKFRLPEKKNFKTFSKGMKMKMGIAIRGSTSRLPITLLYSSQILSRASGVSKGDKGVNSISV